MRSNIFVSEILERLTMQDVLENYHNLGKRKRTQCPFHNGDDNNFCYTDHVYHCWVCDERGNVFSFVKKFYNLDTLQAISKINYDFGLGLAIDRKLTIREMQEFKQKERKRVAERERIQKEKQQKENSYQDLWDEWVRLDKNMRDYAPKTPTDELHPLFIEACHKIQYQSYLIDCLT